MRSFGPSSTRHTAPSPRGVGIVQERIPGRPGVYEFNFIRMEQKSPKTGSVLQMYRQLPE